MSKSLVKNHIYPVAKSLVMFSAKRNQGSHSMRHPHDALGRYYMVDLKSIKTIPVSRLQGGFGRSDDYTGRNASNTVYSRLASQYKELYSLTHDKMMYRTDPVVTDVQTKETTRKLQQLLDRSQQSAIDLGNTAPHDDQTLHKFGCLHVKKPNPKLLKEQSLAQIRYIDGVYLICAINSDDIMQVQRHLAPVLSSFGASFSSAMELFHNCGYVDAVISPRRQGDFEDLDTDIKVDAKRCGADGASFVSYERGIVRFKCNPLRLQEVCARLKEKSYIIRKTDYGFIAKRPVQLTHQEVGGYERFVKQLLSVKGLDAVYDNIKRPSKKKIIPPCFNS